MGRGGGLSRGNGGGEWIGHRWSFFLWNFELFSVWTLGLCSLPEGLGFIYLAGCNAITPLQIFVNRTVVMAELNSAHQSQKIISFFPYIPLDGFDLIEIMF
jgi:hypothetical protein